MTIIGHEKTPPMIHDIADSQGLFSHIQHKLYTRNNAEYYKFMIAPLIKCLLIKFLLTGLGAYWIIFFASDSLSVHTVPMEYDAIRTFSGVKSRHYKSGIHQSAKCNGCFGAHVNRRIRCIIATEGLFDMRTALFFEIATFRQVSSCHRCHDKLF